jgi:putative ABC transport system permease protein
VQYDYSYLSASTGRARAARSTWVSTVVALPVAWYLVGRWLDGFAYRVDLDFPTFVGAVLATWLVACTTVLTHVLRAARARPVEALRYE